MNNILLIIGASSDLGLDLIKNTDKNTLIIAHYNSYNTKLEEMSKVLDNKLITIKGNLTLENDVENLIKEIEEKYGIPNQIVNFAASKFTNIRFKDISWNDFEKDIDISLKSYVHILNRFLPKLVKEKRKASIVTILSSVVLNIPPKNLVHYTTIKYALLGLSKSLASEYSDKNINVNCISPSMIETKFLSEINEKFVELSAYSNPKKRNASVSDITPAIKFLLSDDSSYITGVNMPITAGSVF